MNQTEVLASVSEVAKKVFSCPDFTFTEATTATDVREWDSLSNIELIVCLEETFQVHFDLGELQDLPNLGALVDLIMAKL
jgi:acyl carrier protein